MPYCPNPECLHRIKTGKPAEFMEGIESCSDCGASLTADVPVVLQETKPLFTDLTKRILFTLFILALFRVASHLAVPGINIPPDVGLFLMILGDFPGTFGQLTIVFLGFFPYFVSYIVVEILALYVSPFKEWKTLENEGRRRISVTVRVLTIITALALSYVITVSLEGYLYLSRSLIVLTLTAGAFFPVFLADQITSRGIGHGISVLFFANGVYSMLLSIIKFFLLAPNTGQSGLLLMTLVTLGLFIILAVVVESAARRIRVRYRDGFQADLPLKLTTAGLVPAWVLTFLFMPLLYSEYLGSPLLMKAYDIFYVNNIVYFAFSFTVIVFSYYLFTSSFHNTERLAGWIHEKGAALDVPSEIPAEDYLDKRIERMAFIGVLYLGFYVLFPDAVYLLSDGGVILDGVATILFIAIILDLRQEILARMRSTAMVKVSEMHDVDMAGLAKSVLENKGIPCTLRGYYHRALLYFFGPMIEISVLVPADREDEAREALERYVSEGRSCLN